MAEGITIDAKTDRGEPISALSRVIEQRVKELGESTRNATIATAINILKSLRADTRVARDKSVFVTVTEVNNVVSSYKAGHRRCLRVAGRRGAEVTGRKTVFLVGKRLKDVKERVFLVRDKSKSGERDEDYYIVAFDKASADEYAKKRRAKRIKAYKGLAKRALGIAMNKISTANEARDSVTSKAESVARRNVGAALFYTGKSAVEIDVNDLLNYAEYALKSGSGGVAMAARRAANKTIGIINNYLNSRSIRRKLEVPFPEIKGR